MLLPCKGFKARIPLKHALTFLPVEPAGVTTRDLNRSMHIISLALVVKCPHNSTYYDDAKSLTVIMQPGSPPPSAEFGFTKTARPPSWRFAPNIRGRSHRYRIAIAITNSSFISISISCNYPRKGMKRVLSPLELIPNGSKWGFNGTFSHPCEIQKSLGGHVCHTGSQASTFLRGVHEKSSNRVAYPKQQGSGMLRVLAGSPFQWTDSGTTGYELVA